MIHEAIILAGGLGTRLRSAVPDLPKCMAPVAGRPFLSFLIDDLQKQGITKFIFSLGYKHEHIEAFLKKSYPSLSFSTYIEEEPLGTGGAIMQAAALASTTDVLALNGDTMFRVDIAALSHFHQLHQADCTLALKPMKDSERYGIVELNAHQQIISFREKQWYAESLINGGIYALNIDSFTQEQLPAKFSFEKDFLEAYYPERRMYGFVEDAYFIDIGIPEDYLRAQTELLPYA